MRLSSVATSQIVNRQLHVAGTPNAIFVAQVAAKLRVGRFREESEEQLASLFTIGWNLSEFSNIGVQILGRTRSNTHPSSGKPLNAYAI